MTTFSAGQRWIPQKRGLEEYRHITAIDEFRVWYKIRMESTIEFLTEQKSFEYWVKTSEAKLGGR